MLNTPPTTSWTRATARDFLWRELRRFRREMGEGWTQARVAEAIGVTLGTISHIETGKRRPNGPTLRALLTLYGQAGLIPMFEEALRVARKRDPAAPALSAISGFDLLLGYEQGAAEIKCFQGMCVHGLLQTRRYAAEILRAWVPRIPNDDVTGMVDQRIERQKVLTRDSPPRLSVVLAEEVLRRMVGGPAVMAEQLTHLIDVIEYPSVELRILPMGLGAHAAMHGAFTVFHFPMPSQPPIAYTESPVMGHFYENTDQVAQFEHVLNALGERCPDLTRSAALIDKIRKEVQTG